MENENLIPFFFYYKRKIGFKKCFIFGNNKSISAVHIRTCLGVLLIVCATHLCNPQN